MQHWRGWSVISPYEGLCQMGKSGIMVLDSLVAWAIRIKQRDRIYHGNSNGSQNILCMSVCRKL